MQKKDLYFYKGENGGAVQTLVKIPGAEFTPMYRLIADDGKELTDGSVKVSVIDIAVDDLSKWSEVEKKVEEAAKA